VVVGVDGPVERVGSGGLGGGGKPVDHRRVAALREVRHRLEK